MQQQQSYNIDPDHFRRVARTLQCNPNSALIITGPERSGKQVLLEGVLGAFPALRGRVFKTRNVHGRPVCNINIPTPFNPLFIDYECPQEHPFAKGVTVKRLSLKPFSAQPLPLSVFLRRHFEGLVEEIRIVAGRSDPLLPSAYRFFAQERLEWDPRTHRHVSEEVKRSVRALLLLRNRVTKEDSGVTGLADLPLEIMFTLFAHIQRTH